MGAFRTPVLQDRRSRPRDERNLPVANGHMLELLTLAERVATSAAKVLITGESGVGKDLIARHIHVSSGRRGEYVAVNCAGVTESLLESELFGHAKGSFTGAYRDKAGKLQMAHRGTLFLDEVGEMSLRMQAVLLRFLENGEVQPVGGGMARSTVDVRVIAATNRDLTQLVATGQFREDLLYRLRVVHLHVRPLRERLEEIRPLAAHFLARTGRQVRVTDEAWQALERYRWPGNVRELQNVIEQMLAQSTPEAPLGIDHVPAAVKTTRQAILVAPERRRQVADELFRAIVHGGYSFWEHIHPLFLNRDITRHDVRELVRRGLSETHGNYRSLLQLFGIPAVDYKRFMNFLGTHDCRADFREFRSGHGTLQRPRYALSPLPSLQGLQERDGRDAGEKASAAASIQTRVAG